LNGALLFAVAAGGALGALARFGVSNWVHDLAGTSFPWGTMVVNVTGSFLFGLLYRWMESTAASPALRAGVLIGLLGAFTTFSTFSYEAVVLAREGQYARALVYVVGSVVAGLCGLFLGYGAGGALAAGR
jgi:CrcB protein